MYSRSHANVRAASINALNGLGACNRDTYFSGHRDTTHSRGGTARHQQAKELVTNDCYRTRLHFHFRKYRMFLYCMRHYLMYMFICLPLKNDPKDKLNQEVNN